MGPATADVRDEQLHNEIAVMKRLDHPGIVRLYETYTSVAQGAVFLIMELCEGGELFERLMGQPGHRYTERAVARLAQQLLGPVRYCHDQGIVHRDLKLQVCPLAVH